MPELAVTAIGRDRPGIVAAISGALLELDGNIEDSQMSILGGHFSVMLLVHTPEGVTADQVGERLARVRDELGLEAVAVNEVDQLGHTARTATHVLSVYGADRLGIVHGVSQALAELGVNICDLETRVTGTEEAPVYVMLLEVALGQASPEEVESALRQVGGETGVEVNLRELDSEAL
ncbi:MAG TPA: ACT domain-containing protein [Solirubrobacterales bacterium]|jgi:glycine cleavage system transcriptional repressor